MALITCHECQQQISDKAPACPHCGVPAQPVPAAPATKPAGTTDYTLRIKQVIFAIFVGMIVLNYIVDSLPGLNPVFLILPIWIGSLIWCRSFLRRKGRSPIESTGGAFIASLFIFAAVTSVTVDLKKPARAAKEAQAAVQKAADSKASTATRAREDAECRKSLNCWGAKHSVLAIMKCQDQIEHLAKYQAQWTDGILEAKFSRSQWLNVEHGVVRYSGDKIKFQNGFGAWMNQVYECDYNTEHDAALAVRAQPGRLP